MAMIVVIAFLLLSAWCVAGFVVALVVGRAFAEGARPAEVVAPSGPEALAS